MDMIRMETFVETEGKSLDWTLVRPSYLINCEKERFSATERVIKCGSFRISRLNTAKFIIHEIENNLWIHSWSSGVVILVYFYYFFLF